MRKIGIWILEEKILNFVSMFSLFYNSPPGKERGPSFEPTWIPITQGCFVSSLFEIYLYINSGGEDFWFRQYIFAIYILYSPQEKGVVLHLSKLGSPSPKDALYEVYLKMAQWFWRRRWKCDKLTDRRTDRRTDDRQSEKLTWACSSGELNTVGFISNLIKIRSFDPLLILWSAPDRSLPLVVIYQERIKGSNFN